MTAICNLLEALIIINKRHVFKIKLTLKIKYLKENIVK